MGDRIGLLLAYVAFVLGRDNADLLIGETAEPDLVVDVHDRLLAHEEVADRRELLTMHLGPASALVAARVDLRTRSRAARSRSFSERADPGREAHPEITEVFLDPTRRTPTSPGGPRARRPAAGGGIRGGGLAGSQQLELRLVPHLLTSHLPQAG